MHFFWNVEHIKGLQPLKLISEKKQDKTEGGAKSSKSGNVI